MRLPHPLSLVSLVAAAAGPLPCAAADPAAVLARTHWRVEADVQAACRGGPGRALRLGVGGELTLRAEQGGVTLEAADTQDAADPTDDLLSTARWHLRAGNAGGFAGTPWLAGAPASTSAWRAAGLRPAAHATAEWVLPQDLTLSLSPGLLVDRDDDGRRRAAGVLALSVGKAWSPQWRGLVGLSGRSHADAPLSLDAGLAFRAGDAMQLDVTVSHGLAGTSSVQAGLGLSARF